MIHTNHFFSNYFRFFAGLAMLGIVFFALAPTIYHPGWPQNHEWWAFFDRIRVYSLHFRQHDYFPLWSSGDGMGLGTPLPLFYHKLFYFISGLLYLVTEKMKLSVLLTIAMLMVTGIVGTYKACKAMGLSRLISLTIALCLPLLNYTISNWFVRGAMAEFSAMMIVPFLFYWCIIFVRTNTFKLTIVPIFILLYLAHSVIAYYSLFVVLGVVLMQFWFNKISVYKTICKGLLVSGLILIILSVYLVPMLVVSPNYHISKITNASAMPRYQFQQIGNYFYDEHYKWLADWQPLTMQLDLAVVFCILTVLLLLFYRYRKLNSALKWQPWLKRILLFLIITNVFFFLLQCRFMNFFYEWFPGAKFIQFPWRLLSFIQVLNLLIFAALIAKLMSTGMKKNAQIIVFACFLALCIHYPLYRRTNFSWFADDFIESQRNEYGTYGIGEYMPDVSHIPAEPIETLKDYFVKLHALGVVVKSGNCEVKAIGPVLMESLQASYKISCKSPSLVIFPHNFSGLEVVTINGLINSFSPPWYRTNIDPRIHVLLPVGEFKLTIYFPVLKNLFRKRNIIPVKNEEFKVIVSDFCNMEKQSANGLWFIWRGNEIFETGYSACSEKSYSGKYSARLSSKEPYALKHEVKMLNPGEVIEVSICRNSESGSGNLVVRSESGKFNIEESRLSQQLKNGWEFVKIRFIVPHDLTGDRLFVYVYHSSGKYVYFDNLTIKRWKP